MPRGIDRADAAMSNGRHEKTAVIGAGRQQLQRVTHIDVQQFG